MMCSLARAVVCTLVCLLLPPGETTTSPPSSEIYALSDLFEATGGASGTWINDFGWDALLEDDVNVSSLDPCAPWYGVACDTSEAHITEIVLTSNRLEGALPSSLWVDLPRVQRLDFDVNDISGVQPSQSKRQMV